MFWTQHRIRQTGDSNIGVKTDDEEMGPGSTVTDGVEITEKTCGFEQETDNEKSLSQDADGDVGIQDRKMAEGTGTPLIPSLQNMPSQQTSGALNTGHNEAQIEHTDEGDSVLSYTPTLLRPDADKEDEKTELSHCALVNLSTDTSADDKCVKLEECSFSLQLAELIEILETDLDDAWNATCNALNEISLSDARVFKQELPFNPDIGQIDEKGYRVKGTGIPLITPLQNMPSQHTSSALNTEHNEAQIEHTDQGYSVLSNTPTSLRPDADIEDKKTELSHSALVNMNTDTSADDKCVKLEERSSFLQLAEIMKNLETDCYDDWDAMFTTPLNKISLSDDSVLKQELPFNHDIDQVDEEGYTPLYKAASEGHLEGVDILISRGANPNISSKGGLRPLHAAAQEGHTHIVDFLILQGADVRFECELGQTPLHTAAAKGYVDILESFVAEGSDVNVADNTGWTPFNATVQEGHTEALKYIMTKGAEQNRYDGMTPLYVAAELGHLDIVKLFISSGADVNEEDDEGNIPLRGAAIRGHMKVMEYLIQQGSDVNKCDAKGWAPINAAIQFGHLEAVKYLMTEGAKQNRSNGMTPLFAAAYFGHLDIIKFFLSNGADMNEEDDEGMIPLHGAASGGHIEVIEYLIQQGSDVNKKDNDGLTAFNAAVQYGNLGAAQYLMAKTNWGTKFYGLTPLHITTQSDHIEVVNFLVNSGYDVNERNECGKSPLHVACYNENMDIVKVLVHHSANIYEQDHNGWTPINAAAQEGHHDADMNLKDINGLTPHQAAVHVGHSHVMEGISLRRHDPGEEETGDPRPGCHQNLIPRGNITATMRDVDTQSRSGKVTSQVDFTEEVNYCNQADNAKRGADKLSLKNLSTGTNDVEKDIGRPNVNEQLSPRTGDPNEDDTGDPLSGGHHYGAKHFATSDAKKKVIQMEEVDTQSRTGQLAYHVDNVEDGYECTLADNVERGADELSLKSLPTRIHSDEKGGNGEHNPFIHAKLKYPDKGEQDLMLDQMEAVKCIGTRERDTITNRTDCSSPHGSQTWQYSGFDPPFLQTMETDCHPSEEPESRCHSLIDKNRDMRESSSPTNAGNNLPINETSVKFESFPTHPPAVVHHKLYDGNPVSTKGTSSNPVLKIGTKRRSSVARCPSILALIQTFLQMIIAVAIILAGSPVLVAGRDSAERVTLQAGKPGVVPFHLPWPSNSTSRGFSSYTLGFKSEPRPFCNNGQPDIEGFKNPSQLRRFTTSVTDLDTSPCVNLMIDNVDTLDEGGYVLTAVWHSSENVRYETMMKEIVVQIPPGRAKCFITLTENGEYPYEVHCRAITGSVATTLSCYQNERRIDVKGDITDNGQVTSGIFWLPDYTHFSCCSHDVSLNASETMCNDFEWPHVKETTTKSVNTVPTSVTTPTPQIESHTESRACRQFTLPSLWHFTYLFVYFLAFVTMY